MPPSLSGPTLWAGAMTSGWGESFSPPILQGVLGASLMGGIDLNAEWKNTVDPDFCVVLCIRVTSEISICHMGILFMSHNYVMNEQTNKYVCISQYVWNFLCSQQNKYFMIKGKYIKFLTSSYFSYQFSFGWRIIFAVFSFPKR
jgi:hypothetical protein